jgi:hypothetical protein
MLELHRALEQNEYLCIDNLLLARRLADLERRLELASRPTSSGGLVGSFLFGWKASSQEDALLAESMVR